MSKVGQYLNIANPKVDKTWYYLKDLTKSSGQFPEMLLQTHSAVTDMKEDMVC